MSLARTVTWESGKCSPYFEQLCTWIDSGVALIKKKYRTDSGGKISFSATVSHHFLDKLKVMINKALTDIVTALSLASSLVTYLYCFSSVFLLSFSLKDQGA